MILVTFPHWGVEGIKTEIGADVFGLVLMFGNSALIMNKCSVILA
jgi:hypothetical protein